MDQANKNNINDQRIIFGNKISADKNLMRYQLCDIFLDTFPYNAGTTASDALWMGLPVLTCVGESFASRMAASLLTALDMPELITQSLFEYEALAVELATNSEKMLSIKRKLRCKKKNGLLFNTSEFTKKIEQAYVEIYERNSADLLPFNLIIKG